MTDMESSLNCCDLRLAITQEPARRHWEISCELHMHSYEWWWWRGVGVGERSLRIQNEGRMSWLEMDMMSTPRRQTQSALQHGFWLTHVRKTNTWKWKREAGRKNWDKKSECPVEKLPCLMNPIRLRLLLFILQSCDFLGHLSPPSPFLLPWLFFPTEQIHFPSLFYFFPLCLSLLD